MFFFFSMKKLSWINVTRSATMQSMKLPTWNLKEPLKVTTEPKTTANAEETPLLLWLKPRYEAGRVLGSLELKAPINEGVAM